MANTSLAGKWHSLSGAAKQRCLQHPEKEGKRAEDSEAGIKYYLPRLCLS